MKIQIILVAILFVALSAAKPSTDEEWKEFKSKHGKSYKNSTEELSRRKNFDNNKAKIDKHNEEAAAGKHSWTMGVNQFSDLTQDEFVSTLTEVDQSDWPQAYFRSEMDELDRQTLPASYDLNATACMRPPRHQGQCGCCWSFAAVGVLEYLQCKKMNNTATILSEQNLVDCSSAYGNAGCNGGLALWAFEYAKTNGVNLATSYPYKGTVGTCAYSATKAVAKVASWGYATQNWTESAIATALVKYGPVAVSIDASYISSYSTGVFVDTACSKVNTNHAVVVVGYGRDVTKNLDYWVIRNSWGTSWGMKGYFRFKRGVNQCAIAKRPVYAVLA